MPRTRLGRFFVGLLVAFLALFALFQKLVISGQRGDDNFSSNQALSIPPLATAISTVFAFLTDMASKVLHGTPLASPHRSL